MTEILSGRCLCGAIEFEVADPNPMVMCHCKQCRQWAGHAWTSITVNVETLNVLKGEDKLKWYISSGIARRGFLLLLRLIAVLACGQASRMEGRDRGFRLAVSMISRAASW